jgi:hypothetical protein
MVIEVLVAMIKVVDGRRIWKCEIAMKWLTSLTNRKTLKKKFWTLTN